MTLRCWALILALIAPWCRPALPSGTPVQRSSDPGGERSVQLMQLLHWQRDHQHHVLLIFFQLAPDSATIAK